MMQLMQSTALVPRKRWTVARMISAILFFAFMVHYSAGTNAWFQWIWAERVYMRSLADLGDFWDTLFAPAFQCVLLLVAAFIGLFETLCAFRRACVWLGILVLGSISAFAIDATFVRYQYSVDVATKEYWDGGSFCHVYYTWWWYNDRWFGVPWYRDRG